MRSKYLNKNAQDASNYIEDKLNDPLETILPGFYLVKRPIKTYVDISKSLYGVTLFSTENHDILHCRNRRIEIAGLTLDSSLVEDPTPDVSLIRLLYKRTLMQFCNFDRVNLHGDIYNRKSNGREKKLKEGGNTGILSDAVSPSLEVETSNNPGELHWNNFNVHARYLDTAISLRRSPGVSISRNWINITGLRCKQLIDIDGDQNRVYYDYNMAHTLFEDEKDRDLVSVHGRYNEIRPRVADWRSYMEPLKKWGQTRYAHKYKLTVYSKESENKIITRPGDWGEIKYG